MRTKELHEYQTIMNVSYKIYGQNYLVIIISLCFVKYLLFKDIQLNLVKFFSTLNVTIQQ